MISLFKKKKEEEFEDDEDGVLIGRDCFITGEHEDLEDEDFEIDDLDTDVDGPVEEKEAEKEEKPIITGDYDDDDEDLVDDDVLPTGRRRLPRIERPTPKKKQLDEFCQSDYDLCDEEAHRNNVYEIPKASKQFIGIFLSKLSLLIKGRAGIYCLALILLMPIVWYIGKDGIIDTGGNATLASIMVMSGIMVCIIPSLMFYRTPAAPCRSSTFSSLPVNNSTDFVTGYLAGTVISVITMVLAAVVALILVLIEGQTVDYVGFARSLAILAVGLVAMCSFVHTTEAFFGNNALFLSVVLFLLGIPMLLVALCTIDIISSDMLCQLYYITPSSIGDLSMYALSGSLSGSISFVPMATVFMNAPALGISILAFIVEAIAQTAIGYARYIYGS